MRRTLFDADHHAFRESVGQFVRRTIEPAEESMIEQRYIDRASWLEAGRNGYLGPEAPEKHGGRRVLRKMLLGRLLPKLGEQPCLSTTSVGRTGGM